LLREDDLKRLPDLGGTWLAIPKEESLPAHNDPAWVRLLETTGEDPV